MEIREGSRSRNNKLIFITAGVILMLILLSLQTQPKGKVVKISVGDSSFQVANMLTRAGIAFKSLVVEGGEGIVVDYSPVSPLARLNTKGAGSHYEIFFGKGKVAEIIWRDKHGEKLASLLSAQVKASR